MLTDKQCSEFFRLADKSFYDVIREIHEAGQVYALEELIKERDLQREKDREEASSFF